MELINALQIAIPLIAVVLTAVVIYTNKITKISKDYENYRNDEFRREIEQQIYKLQKELYVSKERFYDVNHLVNDVKYANSDYFNNYKGSNKLSPISFLNNLGVSDNVTIKPKQVFVLTPFNEQFDEQYAVIKNAVSKYGFTCVRGDDSKRSSLILGHIVAEIASSRIIIANLSGRNPNVFYELGIAHALGKPVLLVSETLDEVPFDIKNQRILTFNSYNELSENLSAWFISTILDEA
ncbi:hypothetical protein ACET8C_05015 [Aeromonas veronii]|nr:hypothetical protein [Aeromonas dhakensis]